MSHLIVMTFYCQAFDLVLIVLDCIGLWIIELSIFQSQLLDS